MRVEVSLEGFKALRLLLEDYDAQVECYRDCHSYSDGYMPPEDRPEYERMLAIASAARKALNGEPLP